jgi:hypothetical protein
MKLPNEETAEFEAWCDDELAEIQLYLRDDTKLKSLLLCIREDISLNCLEEVAEELSRKDITTTLDYEGPIADDEIARVMREAGVKYTFSPRKPLSTG